jgi:glycosyltransferase involved in cell wall biosynthesis
MFSVSTALAIVPDAGWIMNGLKPTVVITSKDRRDDLRRALASCMRQTAEPEILVIDDGSSDGTAEMVRREFPTVRLLRDETSKGLIVQRNRGASRASGDVIISIDDDADFPSSDTIAHTLREFTDPRIGAVAIPFVNVNYSDEVLQRAPPGDSVMVTSAYIGTAHAVRRDVFLQLGGYREYLFHQGEEEDFCIRMLNAGFVVRLGSANPIHHYESPNRSRWRMDVYGARNKVLFSWYNVPMPHLLMHLPAVILNRLVYGIRTGRLWRSVVGISKGLAGCVREAGGRRPVRPETYRAFRRLRTSSNVFIADIERELAPGLNSIAKN